jgi:hypothetical protein
MPCANRMTTPVAIDEAQIEGRYAPLRAAGRVHHHDAAELRHARQAPGTEGQHVRLGGIDVIDHDVEMHLLRRLGSGQCGC